jgi:hypothetical protein
LRQNAKAKLKQREVEEYMSIPKAELSEALLFRPGHGGDPVPWLLQHLDKQQILQLASIQLEMHRAVAAANSKALEQITALVKNAGH